MATTSIRKSSVVLSTNAINGIIQFCNSDDAKFNEVLSNLNDYVVIHRRISFRQEQWKVVKIEDMTAEAYGGWLYEHPGELIKDNGLDLAMSIILLAFHEI